MPIKGTVVTQGGQPIEDVHIYGSLGKCCPVQRDQTVTDKTGAFGLQHPGPVIHFFKENLQSQSLVIQPSQSALRMPMSPSANAMSVSGCGPLQQGQRRIGWGQAGPKFTVSESIDVQGGKPDADFVRYVIKRKHGRSSLELLFGIISVDPYDDRFIDSIDFAQRLLLLRNEGYALSRVVRIPRSVGLDSRGHSRGRDFSAMQIRPSLRTFISIGETKLCMAAQEVQILRPRIEKWQKSAKSPK